MATKQLKSRQEGLEYARTYCAKQEKCRKEVRDKLVKQGLSKEDAVWVAEQLVKENYINEQRYADLYVQSKINQNRWGRIKIKRMLLSMGIPVDCINKACSKIDEQQYKKVLEYLFTRKLSSLKVEDDYQRKYRLRYFLSSHGFENDLIEEVFSENYI
ncbi:MAG: regulatory protein RecX [Bacteroidales bacterium]|nr:regulatory protein RecX [Bacteroidales bacterium]